MSFPWRSFRCATLSNSCFPVATKLFSWAEQRRRRIPVIGSQVSAFASANYPKSGQRETHDEYNETSLRRSFVFIALGERICRVAVATAKSSAGLAWHRVAPDLG